MDLVPSIERMSGAASTSGSVWQVDGMELPRGESDITTSARRRAENVTSWER